MNVINPLAIYNPGLKDKQNLIDEFVVRTKILKLITDDLSTSTMEYPEQNYMLIGQRGAGKTTLLHRIKYSVEDNRRLNGWLIPVVFTEEQYGINDLNDFWFEIINYLHELDITLGDYDLSSITEERHTYDHLIKILKKNKKKLILLVDNINILFSKFTDIELKKLRSIFSTEPSIRLIGASTIYFDEIFDYGKPFFEFFKIIPLGGLSTSEIKSLLEKLSELHNEKSKIHKIINTNPERIEVLKRLTGGVPRTIALLFQIFIDNKEEKSIRDLQAVLDTVTPLYKAKLDDLPAQQQKIIDAVAKHWDPITTKELVNKTKLESKIISSQLRQLEKNNIIEKIIQQNNKNHLYIISERFLNIWYLMRFGKKSDKGRVIWLVRFLETWCDKLELERRVSEHISNIQKGIIDSNAAILMGEAYISCKSVDRTLKDQILKITKVKFPQYSSDFSISDQDLLTDANEYLDKKNYSKSVEVLNSIRHKNLETHLLLGYNYYHLQKITDSIKHFDLANKIKEDEKIINNIGILYEVELEDLENAESYYTMAEKLNSAFAAHRLGHIYIDKYKDSYKAEFHYLNAIKRGDKKVYNCLGRMYLRINEDQKAKKTFLLGIKNKIYSCYDGLGVLNSKNNDFKNAEKNFLKAKTYGYRNSINKLAKLYLNQDNYIQNINNYNDIIIDLKKIAKDNPAENYYLLGSIYLDKKSDIKNGIKYLMKSASYNHTDAFHRLGHYYQSNKKFQKAIEYFDKAILGGDESTVLCLTNMYLKNSLKKIDALKLIEENLPRLMEYSKMTNFLYASVLLWNNQFTNSVNTFRNFLNECKDELVNDENKYADVIFYVMLLISKNQFQLALNLFNNKEFDLQKMYKPLYYALLTYLKEEFPNEIIKVTSEIKETVEEIVRRIDDMKIAYK